MSESITELARTEVRAISVPMRPHPNQLLKLDEMLLQANGDGTVQVDLFGTDAQGKPYHESRALDEERYEQLRTTLLELEVAAMPPFGSFRSGNTLGRIVGETAPSKVSAWQANPSIEVEAELEKNWWTHISPWAHGSLDLMGFTPGIGAIPDMINAGIYAVEGDTANATLSATAAIPFVGDTIKGSVLIGKSISKTGKKSTKNQAKKNNSGGRILGNEKCRLRPYKPDTCKAQGLTGHHVVPDRVFRQGPRTGKNRNQISGGLSESDGLVICVKGKGLTDQHGKIHKIYDPLETVLGLKNHPPGTARLFDLEVIGALAVANVTGCNPALLEAQLGTYHEIKGLPGNLKVRADKSGKLIKSAPPHSLGKMGAGDF